MRYERIIRKVMTEPWLITRAAHESIVSLIESKLAKAELERPENPRTARPTEDWFGEPIPGMEIDANGIATIPIVGVIGKGLGAFEKSCGAVGTEDIEEDLRNAKKRGARGVVLNIDSPGGTVGGIPELYDFLTEIQEGGKWPVASFASGSMCSGAYWIGCAAYHGAFATKSSDIGSIGVYRPFVDRTKSYEMLGLRVELIKAGKLKGAGYPGTALTDEQRAHMQAEVDSVYAMFTKAVRAYRPNVSSETMQGQDFLAEEAQNRGLIDGIVTGIDQVKQRLLRR